MNSLNEDERTKTLALSIASNKNLKCKHCKTLPFLKLNSGHIRLELLHNQHEVVKLVCGKCEENGRTGNKGTCYYYICLKSYTGSGHSIYDHMNDVEMKNDFDDAVAQDVLDDEEDDVDDRITEHAGADHVEDDHFNDEMDNGFDGMEHGDDEDYGAIEFDPNLFFSLQSGWSKEERNFFIAEHNVLGGGLKYIVWRSLVMTSQQRH